MSGNKSSGRAVAIVTGAASGIGRAVALRLADRGVTVIAVDKDAAGLEQTQALIAARHGQATCYTADLAIAGAIARIVDETWSQYGRLDYQLNLAGISIVAEIAEMTAAQWQRIMATNFGAIVEGASAAYRVMREQGSGHIVNMASAAGLFTQAATAGYTASKHAVVGFSLSLRAEAKVHGVTVTTLCPGYIDTPLFEHAENAALDWREIKAALPLTPMPVDTAAVRILRAMDRGQTLTVFPFHARFFWWLSRLSLRLSLYMTERMLRDFRLLRRRRLTGKAP